MERQNHDEIRLRVGELTERTDFGRGIARLDAKKMQRIGVKEGDIIELSGGRTAPAIAVRSYPADVGLDVVRMDGLLRRNIKSGIGETVSVKKADVKEAKHVIIAPARQGIIIRMNPQMFKQNLLM